MKFRFVFRFLTLGILLTPALLCRAESPDEAAWLAANAIKPTAKSTKDASSLRWCDGTLLTMEGHPFQDTTTSYSRLSSSREGQVTNGVWTTGLSAAGVALRFVTDSSDISVSWGSIKNPMAHMAWTGSGGMDLYAREGEKWVYRATGFPRAAQNLEVLQTGLPKKATEYLLCLPLYSPVDKVEVGIGEAANLAPGTNRYVGKLPIVFYGTSITQGGCASRTGMCHTSILRRWLDTPVINLGFSGSGKCEPVMADILAQIPAALYVIETVPNMDTKMIKDRTVPFITALRTKSPDTPILMVEGPNVKNGEPNAEWRKAFDQLTSSGVTKLHYLAGNMYNTREEATVDGTHPTDLGFYQMSLVYEPALRGILNEADSSRVAAFQKYN